MKKILGLLASAGLIWVGIQLETQAYPYRAIQGTSSSNRVNNIRTVPYNYYPRQGDSYYYEQRIIIEKKGGYDNCYRCYGSSYNGAYDYPRSYNRGPVFYPNSPYSIYNRYNRGY